jgi:thioredoxin reductase
MTSSSERTVEVDLAVVGAGPAGLAAAVTAADAGIRVAVLDLGERIGGQYYRHTAEQADAATGGSYHHGWAQFVDLRVRFRAHAMARRIVHHPRTTVWALERDAGLITVRAIQGERERITKTVKARAVLIATGAHDRHVPFPGWTLPGVMAGGGVQALLKGSGVAAGSRAVVAGTGAFLLPVADGLLAAGVEIAEIIEASAPWRMARYPDALPGAITKLSEAAGYLRRLAKARVPFHTGHAVTAAHGDKRLDAVTVARVDGDWNVVSGSERRVECDLLTVGYGFTPQLELLLGAGCETMLGADGSLIAKADPDGRTTVPRIYAAGETTGVGGSELAIVEGLLCGQAIAADVQGDAEAVERSASQRRRLKTRQGALRRFARALHRTYPVRDGWMTWLGDDTIVCRCEEVAHASIRTALEELGAGDVRTVKLLARPGMGWCQGRICGSSVACLTAHHAGRPPTEKDLAAMSKRTLATPVPLGRLAAL